MTTKKNSGLSTFDSQLQPYFERVKVDTYGNMTLVNPVHYVHSRADNDYRISQLVQEISCNQQRVDIDQDNLKRRLQRNQSHQLKLLKQSGDMLISEELPAYDFHPIETSKDSILIQLFSTGYLPYFKNIVYKNKPIDLKIITLKAANDINNGDYDNDSLSMAKAWCGDVLHRVSQASQHVHGGTGIDRNYHLFRYCLWAKQLELSLGNSKIHIEKLANRLEDKYLAE